MRILVATDKFKGSLTAREVAATIGKAIHRVDSNIEIDLFPIADGGEGTAAILAERLGATRRITQTVDPLGRPIEAESFVCEKIAILDMSAASGLWRLNPCELDPMRATTFGTGLQIRQLIELGVSQILIGLGGSATVDAGLGMAAAIGYRFYSNLGEPIVPKPAKFSDIHIIEPHSGIHVPEIIGLSDVETSLTGENSAILTFGPQKGLSPLMIEELDRELEQLVLRIEKQLGTNFSRISRSGAAGGLGYGILTFLNGRLVSGFEFLAKKAGLHNRIANADLIITGEGKLDKQTLEGKGPFGVARIAIDLNKPVWAVAGMIEDRECLAPYFTRMISLVDQNTSIQEALRAPNAALLKKVVKLLESPHLDALNRPLHDRSAGKPEQPVD
jgi:glycerate 2-kinase